MFSNFQKPQGCKIPNTTRSLIFRDNIYFLQDFIKISGARVNCIKDREFENRHCHLGFGVSICISHLVYISLLRCREIVRLAGAVSCSCPALLRRLVRGSQELLGVPLVSQNIIAFQSWMMNLQVDFKKDKWKQNNFSLYLILMSFSVH